MCLGIPALIVEIMDGPLPMAKLDFAGTDRQCCLAYVPEAEVGDYVFVQNGFAMSVVDAASAAEALTAMTDLALLPPAE